MRTCTYSLTAIVLLGTLLIGCARKPVAEGTPATNATNTTVPTDSILGDTAVAAASEMPAEAANSEQCAPAETPLAVSSPVAPQERSPVASEPTSLRVLLGSPELTAGIPGEGALTTEQIQSWLDNPEIHATLDIELPLGLAAGVAQLSVPADNPLTRAKIELGRQLYFDKRLSADNTVSCADCHHPEDGYARHTQFGVGIGGQQGGRNSPVSYNRILSGAQF